MSARFDYVRSDSSRQFRRPEGDMEPLQGERPPGGITAVPRGTFPHQHWGSPTGGCMFAAESIRKHDVSIQRTC